MTTKQPHGVPLSGKCYTDSESTSTPTTRAPSRLKIIRYLLGFCASQQKPQVTNWHPFLIQV